jgi:uncharacterized protein YbaP (TraB family)
MQKRIILILSFIAQLLGFHAVAQEQTMPQGSLTKHSKSLLWLVSGKNLAKPSYIFGTIHAICQEDYFFTEKMNKALNESNQLILEVNLSDPAMNANMQQRMLLPAGTKLRDYFSGDETYQLFASKLKSIANIDIERFSHFKPFVLISALTMQEYTCPVTVSYEMKLMEAVAPRNISISGLETADSQLEIFDLMKNDEIERLLLDAVSSDSSDHAQEAAMITLYKQEDIEGLYELMVQSDELKQHEAALLTTRNQHWSTLLPTAMQKEPSFIAVGAAHLPGEQGVLNLLRKQGYSVDAVK